ncbi:MAG: hypothetical protein ACT443_15525 [Gemmatimonadota bacterium]
MLKERPALPPGAVLLVAVVALSWAGPLIKFATAPACCSVRAAGRTRHEADADCHGERIVV